MFTIFFDMDGTLAGLYDVPHWLSKLRAYDPSPYKEANTMHNMSHLARLLNKLQATGFISLGIISALSKESTPQYDEAVKLEKRLWLNKHLRSVHWDVIHFIPYDTPKAMFATTAGDILFDDVPHIRHDWNIACPYGGAYDQDEIFKVLKELISMYATA